MTPERKQNILSGIGKGGTITYRTLAMSLLSYIGYLQHDADNFRDKAEMQLNHIEAKLESFSNTVSEIRLDDKDFKRDLTERIEKVNQKVDDRFDKYIFNNPYFKNKDN